MVGRAHAFSASSAAIRSLVASGRRRNERRNQNYGRGYLRVWFEEAWRRYLDDEEQEHEPSKSAKILCLRGD
jgi:hypothetical protein